MIGVNLIPEQQRYARVRRRHLTRWIVVAAVLAGCGAVPLTMGLADAAAAVSLRSETKANQSRLEAARKHLVEVTARMTEVRAQIERAAALRGKRPWSALIAMIGRVMPADVWLTGWQTDPAQPGAGTGFALGQRPGETAATRIVIDAPRTLIMTGYAGSQDSLYQLMSGLKATGVLTRVTLRSTVRCEMFQGRPIDFDLFRFELECGW